LSARLSPVSLCPTEEEAKAMDQSIDEAMTILRPWIGRVRVTEDDIAMPMVRRIAAMLDLDPDAFRPGMDLPPHWFSMFFSDIARQSDLREDGHAIGGVVLPPIPMLSAPAWTCRRIGSRCSSPTSRGSRI
jgi:hypothetical protein